MKKYIVKGRIKNIVEWGKKGKLRKGSYQFLPDTEVILTKNNLAYNPKIQNRFWVRGKNKSGLLATKGIYFKYLFDLRIEEVNSPNLKTLDFIQKNGILLFEENQRAEINDWLEYFEELSRAEKLTGEINDELFLNAQNYVTSIQTLIEEGKTSELIEKHIEFPITVRHFKNTKQEENFDKDEFNTKIKKYFLSEVCESILSTELDSIFPTDKEMLIGNVEISITKKSTFKISKIIYSKKDTV